VNLTDFGPHVPAVSDHPETVEPASSPPVLVGESFDVTPLNRSYSVVAVTATTVTVSYSEVTANETVSIIFFYNAIINGEWFGHAVNNWTGPPLVL